MIIIKYIYISLLFNFIHQLFVCSKAQNWLYSPQYSYIIKASGQQSLFSKILVSSQTGIVFVSAGNQGILVIDPDQQYKVIANLKSDDHVEGFTCTADAKYIFITTKNLLSIYSFQNRNTFTLIVQQSSTTTTDLILNSQEDTLYILQVNGIVSIFDVSLKSNPTLVGQIQWNSQQIYGGVLTQDERFLILCQDYLGLAVFSISKSKNQVIGKLVGSFSGQTQGSSHQAIITTDQRYLISLDNRNGLSFADFSQILKANPSKYPYSFKYYLSQWWPSQVNVPAPYSFCLSRDSNFLFVGVRSIGIYTIDITDKLNPLIYTWAYLPYHGNSISLSPTANYLYFSNSNSFMVFRRMKPILGQKYVSLYNGNHSLGFSQANTRYYWRCDYDPQRQVYIGAFDTDGLWFIDVSDPTRFNVLQSSYKPPNQDANIDAFYALNNYQTLVIAMNDGINFIAVLNVTNYANIKIIQKVPLGLPVNGYIKDFDSNNGNTFLAAAMDRAIAFVDIRTLGNYYVLAVWQFLPQLKGFTTGLMISYDAKYFIGACRGYGYFVLDIQDWNNIKLVNYLDSTGAEQVFESQAYSYQYYLIDGLGGLYIMDQTKLPQFVQFSQLNVPGWTNDITYLQDEKTVIIATMQQGMIYLVDISNNKNPIIISSYQYGDYNGFVSCSTQDFTKLFIDNNKEMRQLPLEVSVQFHTDYIEVLGYSETGDMQFSIINSPDQQIFYVGQTIKLNFCFLYQPLDLVVKKVMLFQKQIQKSLPSWISYNPIEISAVVQITKDAVDPSNIKQPLLNTLVITTVRPLYKNDFLFIKGQCPTNIAQAAAILLQLQQNGVIDENNLVSENLQFSELEVIEMRNQNLFPNLTLEQQTYNSCISNTTKYTLLQAIQNTPVYFMVKSSLGLIIDGSTNNFISTRANLVNIQIEIPKFQGQFIYVNQGSVNIQLNADMNIINIAGRVSNVNSFLQQKVIIFPLAPNQYNQISSVITVTDSINYPIVINKMVSMIPFLAEKQQIQINPNKTLQSQFADDISIQTNFEFSVHSLTFIIPDLNKTVSYEVKRLKGQNYTDLSTNDWLQFDNDTSKFYGVPPQSAFRTSLTIQVTGSDGYTKVSQTFTVHVNQVPFLIVIQWVISILGPITGLFGLYNFRGDIYNIIYRKRNKYSQINCQPNKLFILKIPLILHEADASIQIIKKFQKELKKNQKREKDNVENNKTNKERQSQNFQLKERKQKRELSKLNQIKGKVSVLIGKLKGIVFTNINHLALNYKVQLKNLQAAQNKSIFEQKYLNQNGTLNYEAFFDNLIEYNIKFNLNNTDSSTKTIQNDLVNELGVLRQCLMFQLARKIIKHDQKSMAIYDFLKNYSQIVNPQLTLNDWYKHLLKIQSTDDLDSSGKQIVFPQFSFRLFKLKEALKFLDIQLDFEINELINLNQENTQTNNKNQIFDQVKEKHGINLYLVEQIVFADAAGVQSKLPNSFFPSSGESIYIEPHQINQIIALRYLPGSCMCIERILGLDFKNYGPQGNIQLPNWMQLDTQPGLIVLKGTPDFSNTETILIRISTSANYIIRNFILNVQKDIKKYNQYRKQVSLKQKSPKNKNISRNSKIQNSKFKSLFCQKSDAKAQKSIFEQLDCLPTKLDTQQKQNSKSLIQFSEEEVEIIESQDLNSKVDQIQNDQQINQYKQQQQQQADEQIQKSQNNQQDDKLNLSSEKKESQIDQQSTSNEKKSQDS
ncbi:hypothetical protein TTHERM_000053759 (macronuclear) [Tetrahymena thermophila SB210]|uniref:Dystroglycan-type cadherin-like domain-containing protein n=1 Tax=Tetrahymena thermophila (strain SB210) TaxID=312017 RepID=W7XFC6_TETTS|nr:hypothetical protein TTHERM_000053759 [Tetrahymena thermophila SB210]EWS76522.1 hypothetical protein TTHERM_000053759 [Tetrahymena thermophila SB210]|eukprot:XP_012650943.1 hypothetical protein TTHERM_000053759 [Tetrahymena thermophila SB210]